MQRRTAPKCTPASSNWLTLQKSTYTTPRSKYIHSPNDPPSKRRKSSATSSVATKNGRETPSSSISVDIGADEIAPSNSGDLTDALRRMIFGESGYSQDQHQSGKYLAVDCEMVGVGIDGSESSLGRVSIVNYYGIVQLDEFVKQRESVVDYRTQYSGIRAKDMIKALPFEEVQKKVAELLKDKIVIGHAIHNDLKALLLSHPRSQLRDTQVLAGKFKLVRSKYISLRNLVKQELDLTIQSGEHSSIIDARAAMAIYRLHRKEWERGLMTMVPRRKEKRKSTQNEDNGGGSKCIEHVTKNWWKELG